MLQFIKLRSSRLIHFLFIQLNKNYYYRLHLLYFLVVGFLGGCILKIFERDTDFIDTLFISFSSLTGTGLVSIDLSEWRVISLVTVTLLVQLGSIVMLTLPIIIIRRYYLKSIIDSMKNRNKHLIGHLSETGQELVIEDEDEHHHDNEDDHDENFQFFIDENSNDYSIDLPQYILDDDVPLPPTPPPTPTTISHLKSPPIPKNNNNIEQILPNNNNIIPNNNDNNNGNNNNNTIIDKQSLKPPNPNEKRISIKDKVNIEYRALGKLLKIITIYKIVCFLSGFLILGIYASSNKYTKKIMPRNNVNAWWFALFETVSAFNNSGFSLFPDNMIQLNHEAFVLIILCLLVVFGNTLFPVALRYIIKMCRMFSHDKEPFEYLLGNSRSCFTHLFPEKDTMILFFIWLGFNVAQISLMAILEINEKAFTGMSSYIKFINYLFQSINTRSSGFNSVDISKLSDSVLVLMMGLMFVSSYPFIVQLRKTTVNGKYANQTDVMKDIIVKDLFLPYLAILVISIAEESSLDRNKGFTVFHIIFEIISAFGNVGYSVGFQGTVTSLSAQFHVVSKLTVIIIMLLGKHRTLPDSVDKSISLSEFRGKKIFGKSSPSVKRQHKFQV